MTVSYQDFEKFAAGLLTSSSEMDFRMSAARAYYASYHRALQSLHYCPDNSHLQMGSHERVTERLIAHGTLPAKSIAYVLKSMKKIRHIADYEITTTFDKCDAENQISQHQAVVKRLDAFDQSCAAKLA